MVTHKADFPEGFVHLPQCLDRAAQEDLAAAIRAVVAEAPLFTPVMARTGTPMSVRMTNCGQLGWVTDKERGYRYQPAHPVTGKPWPPMPQSLLDLWAELSGYPHPPQACLVNHYDPQAKMGMHQDRDEQDLAAPVLSVSLGDDCLFKVGGITRGGPTASIRLASGDVVLLAGVSRLAFHGVTRIFPGTSMLLAKPGRINLTLRRVTLP